MSPIELPRPDTDGSTSVERAIATRASRRSFADEPVTVEDVAQLLWAAQGITHQRDEISMRAAPSAGATYPLVAFVEVAPGGCDELDPGLYRYEPTDHVLTPEIEGDVHDDVTAAALGQPVVSGAPVTIALVVDYDRTRREYPDHGTRYVHMEAGHAAQNVHLVCEGRGLISCPVGAFTDEKLADVLDLPDRLDPLYLIPVGRPA